VGADDCNSETKADRRLLTTNFKLVVNFSCQAEAVSSWEECVLAEISRNWSAVEVLALSQ
jgi:hypothetical protein